MSRRTRRLVTWFCLQSSSLSYCDHIPFRFFLILRRLTSRLQMNGENAAGLRLNRSNRSLHRIISRPASTDTRHFTLRTTWLHHSPPPGARSAWGRRPLPTARPPPANCQVYRENKSRGSGDGSPDKITGPQCKKLAVAGLRRRYSCACLKASARPFPSPSS